MALSSSAGTAGDKLHKCAKHQNEEIKRYCREHESFGCNTCMILSHKLCGTVYIHEVSEEFSKQIEYLHYEKCIKDLKDSFADKISKLDADIVLIEKQYANVLSDIRKRRQEVQVYLDKEQSQLEEEALDFKNSEQELMKSLKSAYESVAQQTERSEAITRRLKENKKYNALFFEVKQAKTKISEIQSSAYEISTKYRKQECKWLGLGLLDLQTTKHMLGAIIIEEMCSGPCNTPESLLRQPMRHLNIKSDTDEKTCYATGLAFLSSDRLAVADKMNKDVKIVDFVFDKIISEMKFTSSPRDVTAIPPNKLAVTLGDEKIIQFLSTAAGLTKTDQIRTEGHCRGIQFDDGKLIVTFDNYMTARLDVMTFNGEVLQSFQPNALLEPKAIGLTPDRNQIYVTDLMKMDVRRLSKTGQVTAISEKRHFMGIAVSNRGSVFASSKSDEFVYKFEDDLSNRRVVLDSSDGIRGPISLAICHARNMLVVSCGKGPGEVCNKLHVFQII